MINTFFTFNPQPMKQAVQSIAKTMGIKSDAWDEDGYDELSMKNYEEDDDYSEDSDYSDGSRARRACAKSTGVMNDLDRPNARVDRWSKCSTLDFKNYIRNNGGKTFCLYLTQRLSRNGCGGTPSGKCTLNAIQIFPSIGYS